MREEGEIWEEASGRKFTKVDGKRQQITKIPPKGFDKCDDCEKLILKTIDQQTYNRFKKCKYCQIDFEMKLKREDKRSGTTKWEDWVKEQEEKRWEAVLAEYESEMDGVEMCKILKGDKRTSHIPFLMLTAKTDIEFEKIGLDVGAWDYIAKPFNTNHLIQKIKNIIETRNHFKSFLFCSIKI